MDDNESCGSRVNDTTTSPPHDNSSQDRQKLRVYNEILHRLKQSKNEEVNQPDFEDQLWEHFNRLPTRYALDVNLSRGEEVLEHKKLLDSANDPNNRPTFDVRLVSVQSHIHNDSPESSDISKSERENLPPAFGSAPNPEDPAEETSRAQAEGVNTSAQFAQPMHEITLATVDKPKTLSQLTALVGDMDLNIHEAHVYSTMDGFSIDVFVVSGWPNEETEQLKASLRSAILQHEDQASLGRPSTSSDEQEHTSDSHGDDYISIPDDGSDVWEIDPNHIEFESKIASGSYGDLYKGTFCNQEVAIKVLKPGRSNAELQREFAQEVFIMRKVRHKNVVQFIGACTKPPNLCIITEYMSGGSVYDYLHKQNRKFKLSSLLKVAIDVSKGMDYLHQNDIIHRDLKTANLLRDEHEVVKVSDFGVARVKCQSGIMTAETGTYRWMAPEVIEHKPYDHKADIFSFGVVLWELLTGKIPYENLSPLQAAVGVVQSNLRPEIPKNTHPKIVDLLQMCWQQDPASRPNFPEIIEILQRVAREA